jgi:hypothetical protein
LKLKLFYITLLNIINREALQVRRSFTECNNLIETSIDVSNDNHTNSIINSDELDKNQITEKSGYDIRTVTTTNEQIINDISSETNHPSQLDEEKVECIIQSHVILEHRIFSLLCVC